MSSGISDEVTQLPLLWLTNGFMSFKTFAAAVEMDIFSRLSGGRSVTIDQFAADFDLKERPARLLLAALASLELLHKEGESYRNSPIAEKYLVTGRPDYFGGYVKFNSTVLYPAWHDVVTSIRTNRPALWDPSTQDNVFDGQDEAMVQLFWEAMHSLAGQTANALGELHDFGSYRRLLDVGGGSGGISTGLCRRFGSLSATVYELPHVCGIAEGKIHAAGLRNAVDTTAGDFVKDPELPGGYDVMLLSQILHDWDEKTNRALLEKCWAALPPGGTVIICEFLLNAERTGPAEAALMGMNMLVGLAGGQNYSESEYQSWLTDAGFMDARTIRFESAGANGAIIARKPSR